jgi:hypothetical protein
VILQRSEPESLIESYEPEQDSAFYHEYSEDIITQWPKLPVDSKIPTTLVSIILHDISNFHRNFNLLSAKSSVNHIFAELSGSTPPSCSTNPCKSNGRQTSEVEVPSEFVNANKAFQIGTNILAGGCNLCKVGSVIS